jgi:hypothetical protein
MALPYASMERSRFSVAFSYSDKSLYALARAVVAKGRFLSFSFAAF